MKKLPLLFMALLAAITFNACTDGETEERFPVTITLPSFSVDALGNNGWHEFNNDVVTSGIEAQLNSFGLTLASVKKIEPTSITLTINDPSTGNFNNFDWIEAYVSATGVDPIKVAYNDTVIPQNTNVLELASQYSDIAPAVTKNQFNFMVRGYNNAPVSAVAQATVTLKADIIALVK